MAHLQQVAAGAQRQQQGKVGRSAWWVNHREWRQQHRVRHFLHVRRLRAQIIWAWARKDKSVSNWSNSQQHQRVSAPSVKRVVCAWQAAWKQAHQTLCGEAG
eukprot:6175440-Pleurochrysis_carterae.AAC.2